MSPELSIAPCTPAPKRRAADVGRAATVVHTPIEDAIQVGRDAGRGNLLAVQPHLVTSDYASKTHLFAKLAGYLETARQCGWLNERTVVVFPEHLGTWLVAADEPPRVHRAATTGRAMRLVVARHLLRFLWLLAAGRRPARDLLTYTLFRLKAKPMARTYQAGFARLAQMARATVVAGSIVLPEPAVESGNLAVGQGPLYNVSLVVRPDGSLHQPLVRKAFPTSDEQPFLAAGPADDLPVFETPAGRLAVLVCADSWYPDCYQVLRTQRPDLVAVPAFLSADGVWSEPWRGYNGAPAPADVDPEDIGRLSEREAWLKYALAGRLAIAGAAQGSTVFLRGRLWDLGSDGHTIAVRGGQVVEAQPVSGAALVNLWLD